MDRDARIAKLRADCGCKQGLFALVLAVVAYIFLPQYFPSSETTWGAIGIGVAVALCGAIVGKFAGLLIAELRLRQLLRARTLANHS